MGHAYTQIVSKMGFTHGQLQIESETYSLSSKAHDLLVKPGKCQKEG